MFLIY